MTINERKFIESRISKYEFCAKDDRGAWIRSSFTDLESFVHYQMNLAVVDALELLLTDLGGEG